MHAEKAHTLANLIDHVANEMPSQPITAGELRVIADRLRDSCANAHISDQIVISFGEIPPSMLLRF